MFSHRSSIAREGGVAGGEALFPRVAMLILAVSLVFDVLSVDGRLP